MNSNVYFRCRVHFCFTFNILQCRIIYLQMTAVFRSVILNVFVLNSLCLFISDCSFQQCLDQISFLLWYEIFIYRTVWVKQPVFSVFEYYIPQRTVVFWLGIAYIWILNFNVQRRFDYTSLELEHWTWIHFCRYYISCKSRYCLQCTTMSRVIPCIIDRIWFVIGITIFSSYSFRLSYRFPIILYLSCIGCRISEFKFHGTWSAALFVWCL